MSWATWLAVIPGWLALLISLWSSWLSRLSSREQNTSLEDMTALSSAWMGVMHSEDSEATQAAVDKLTQVMRDLI